MMIMNLKFSNWFIKYILFTFLFFNLPLFASLTAIEMNTEEMILMKNLSVRAYDDTKYDNNNNVVLRKIKESIGGIDWRKYPFYTKTFDTPSLGSVYYSNSSQVLVIAFHGSHWIKDWIEDFKCAQISADLLSNQMIGKVHTGFSNLVKDSYADMIKKINLALNRPLQINDRIYLTGHSLGGALAMLTGPMLSFENHLEKNNIKIITFSSPRGVIGNPDFVKQASEKLFLENILNFSTKGDVVPYLPQHLISPLFRYEPFGINIEISPSEKLIPYYSQAIQTVPKTFSEISEHVAWSASMYLVGLKSVSPAFLVKKGFTVFHALPSDEAIKKAFEYTQYKYRNTSNHLIEVGEFSLMKSVHRNIFLKGLYDFFIK